MVNKSVNITEYLKSNGLEGWKLSGDRRVIIKIGADPQGTPVGEYTGFDATDGGLHDASPEYIFEKYIKPIVEKYHASTT